MKTIAPSPLITANRPAAKPGVEVRWSGIPKSGETCAFTGLGHAYYYSKLLQAPFAEGFVHLSLRERGESKGKRLIYLPSLHRLLSDIAQGKLHTSEDRLCGARIQERFNQARKDKIPHKWLRVPPNGATCWFTGLGHSTFYALLESAGTAIQVAQLQLPKESRATRLVWLPDLHKYLVGLAEKQATKPAAITAKRHAA
jgi:hypothetical protein